MLFTIQRCLESLEKGLSKLHDRLTACPNKVWGGIHHLTRSWTQVSGRGASLCTTLDILSPPIPYFTTFWRLHLGRRPSPRQVRFRTLQFLEQSPSSCRSRMCLVHALAYPWMTPGHSSLGRAALPPACGHAVWHRAPVQAAVLLLSQPWTKAPIQPWHAGI